MSELSKKIAETSNPKFPSELRLDLASRDWVVIATGRARRPETFKKQGKKEEESSQDCPFCDLSGQEPPVMALCDGKIVPLEKGQPTPKNWSVIVIPNKFPAFLPYPNLDEQVEGGLYKKMNAVGFHEVVITRDHKKQIANFSIEETKEIFDIFQARYLALKKEKFVNHISIFHNKGPSAGASIAHPHSQIITTPLIDVDLNKALSRSKENYKKNRECVYCKMNEWEKKVQKRIVFENKDFLVMCPFASKTAFQMIVSPKKHLSNFEDIEEGLKLSLAEAFQIAIAKLYKGLNDPDYNFYLHTAPCDEKEGGYYHWHWTILPKTSSFAGFEFGTRMEISTIEPEKAAEYLREQ